MTSFSSGHSLSPARRPPTSSASSPQGRDDDGAMDEAQPLRRRRKGREDGPREAS